MLSRIAGKGLARATVESLRNTRNYTIVGEEALREKALWVALQTGCTGFDAYIIASALEYNATLVTDDKPMSRYAVELNVKVVLLREVSLDELDKII